MQSIAPLKVNTKQQEEEITDDQRALATELGLTVEEFLNQFGLPDHVFERRKYVTGEPMVTDEEEKLYQRKCATCINGTSQKLYRSRCPASGFRSSQIISTMELVTCGLQMKNYFSYFINWHSTNLSSVCIVCK